MVLPSLMGWLSTIWRNKFFFYPSTHYTAIIFEAINNSMRLEKIELNSSKGRDKDHFSDRISVQSQLFFIISYNAINNGSRNPNQQLNVRNSVSIVVKHHIRNAQKFNCKTSYSRKISLLTAFCVTDPRLFCVCVCVTHCDCILTFNFPPRIAFIRK